MEEIESSHSDDTIEEIGDRPDESTNDSEHLFACSSSSSGGMALTNNVLMFKQLNYSTAQIIINLHFFRY